MAKRVSLKGKGADIFFGDYSPPGLSEPETPSETPAVDIPTEHRQADTGDLTAATSDVAEPVVPTTAEHVYPNDVQAASESETDLARKQESKKVSTLARKSARMRASKQPDPYAPAPDATVASAEDAPGDIVGSAEIVADVWARVDMPATITNSFRYTESELSTLTDVLYEIGKQHGAKLTKQDVARLGLNVVLDEYRRRGAGSLLGKLAARRRQRRGGGA